MTEPMATRLSRPATTDETTSRMRDTLEPRMANTASTQAMTHQSVNTTSANRKKP